MRAVFSVQFEECAPDMDDSGKPKQVSTADSSPKQTKRRVLICRLSAHGDVVQTLPLLHALKDGDPDCRVGWLVEAAAAPLLEDHPLIDRLHVCYRKRWLQNLKRPAAWLGTLKEVQAFIRDIRREKYTASLDVQGLLKSALWPWLAGIPRRLGNRGARENAGRFYTETLAPHPIRVTAPPAVERYLEFAHALGLPKAAPVFTIPPVPEGVQARIDRLLAQSEGHGPLVGLAPFTRWPSKHWRAPYWGQLATLLRAAGMRPVLIGGEGDREAAAQMLKDLPPDAVLNLVGQTGWVDLYALFRRVDVMIGPDSAPLHIANAVGHALIIGLYGSTAPGRTGPIGARHRTLTAGLECQPCFDRHCPLQTDACMKELTPEQVMAAVRERLQAGDHAPSQVGL